MKEANNYKKAYFKEIVHVHDPLTNLAIHTCIQVYTNFPTLKKPPLNSRRQEVDMKQVTY